MISKELLNYIEQFDDKDQIFLFLTNLRHDLSYNHNVSPKNLFKLIEDGVIDKDYITSSFTLLVPYYDQDVGNHIKTTSYTTVVNEVTDHIDEYRNLFKGIRLGSMGNREQCINRMVDFILNHNTSLEEIIRATMYYLERENPEFIMNADNFISNTKGSKLAIVMEDLPKNRLL